MKYRLYRVFSGQPAQYKTRTGWSIHAGDAALYTLHGARSVLGRLQRQWRQDLESRHPDRWGFAVENTAASTGCGQHCGGQGPAVLPPRGWTSGRRSVGWY